MKRMIALALALATAGTAPGPDCYAAMVERAPVGAAPVIPAALPAVDLRVADLPRLGALSPDVFIPGGLASSVLALPASAVSSPRPLEASINRNGGQAASPEGVSLSPLDQVRQAAAVAQDASGARASEPQAQADSQLIFDGLRNAAAAPDVIEAAGLAHPLAASFPEASARARAAGGDGGGSSPPAPPGPGRGRKWLLAAAAAAAVAAPVALIPAVRHAALSVVSSQWATVAGDFASRGAVLGVVSGLSALGYLFSNAVGFVYPFLQVAALFRARSGDVSLAKQATGLGASLLLAFNMFYLNSAASPKLFSAYQNLWGALSFALIVGQALWYKRRPGPEGARSPAWKAGLKTAAALAVVGGLTLGLGAALTAAVPLLPASILIVPFQLLIGVGFSYLTFPEYLKIEREKSVGAASKAMTVAFLGAIAGMVVWSIFQLAILPGIPGLAALAFLAAFTALMGAASTVTFRWLALRNWKSLRESRINLIGFGAVAVFMTAAAAAGYGAFHALFGVPAGQSRSFLTLFFYLVDNILTLTNAALTLKAFRKYAGPR